MIPRNAWEIYSKTFAVCLAMYLAIVAVARLLEPDIPDRTFRWTTAFAIVQAIAIMVLSLHLLVLRTYNRLKESLYDQIRPALRDRVMALAFAGESWSSHVPRYGPARYVLGESIAHALVTLKASGRDRVARFALEHGFVGQWIQDYSSPLKNARKRAILLLGLTSPVTGNTVLPSALHDQHPAVRIEAYRALIASGDPVGIDSVFRLLLGESLLMRALLTDDLKRHASYLLAHSVPSVLEREAGPETAHCFEILVAWKRALPSFDPQPWLSSQRNRFLWPLIFALLPYLSTDSSMEGVLASALEDADLAVQCAAAEAAGGLKLHRLIPALSATLSQDRRLALASAAAIAQMGEPGERCLEQIVSGPDRARAALAMEALERVTVRAQ